jgi:hypothetical protein
MKVLTRYLFLCLVVCFYFIVYNYFLDLIFFKIDYGNTRGVQNGLGYLGYFLVMYLPLLLPFLVAYNYLVTELFLQKKYLWARYGMALLLGVIIGSVVRRSGISFYIGQYRPLKNIILFASIMLSLELTRDVVIYLRNKTKKPHNGEAL